MILDFNDRYNSQNWLAEIAKQKREQKRKQTRKQLLRELREKIKQRQKISRQKGSS